MDMYSSVIRQLKCMCAICYSDLKAHPEDEADVVDFIVAEWFSSSWWTLGDEGAEDSGVVISSMSAYEAESLEPFLLKALLKELRSWPEMRQAYCQLRAGQVTFANHYQYLFANYNQYLFLNSLGMPGGCSL